MPNAPGWYRDPTGLPFDRYWNGTRWTDQTYTPPPSPEYPTTSSTMPLPVLAVAPGPPWYRHKAVVIIASVAGALIVLGAIGSVVSPDKKPTANGAVQNDTPSTPAGTGAPPAVSSRPVAHHPTATLTKHLPSPKPRPNSAEPDGSFVMPDEVGRVLQHAQDDIQRVSADPMFFTHSHDVLGGRHQVLDRDWKVCTQNVRAGRRVAAAGHIDFGVVKLDETCP